MPRQGRINVASRIFGGALGSQRQGYEVRRYGRKSLARLDPDLRKRCSPMRVAVWRARRYATRKTHTTSDGRVCRAADAEASILAEGAMTLPVTLSGGVLFAS